VATTVGIMDIMATTGITTGIIGITTTRGIIMATGIIITDMAMVITITAMFALTEPTSVTKAGIAIRTIIENQPGSLLKT